MKISEAIQKAAELLKARGWTQLTYENQSGCLCATAAIEVVCDGGHSGMGNFVRSPFANTVWHYVTDALGTGTVAGWNDMAGRTGEFVIAKLEEIAAKAAAAGV